MKHISFNTSGFPPSVLPAARRESHGEDELRGAGTNSRGCPSRSQEVDQVHTDLPGALPFKNKLQLLQNSGKNSKSGSQDRARHIGPRASDGINMVQS